APRTGGIFRRWARKWELSPQDLGALEIGFVEFALTLFRAADDSLDFVRDPGLRILQELCLDRVLSGLRIGMLSLPPPREPASDSRPVADITLIIKLPWDSLRVFISAIPAYVGASSQVHVWGVPSEFSLPL